MMDSSDQRTTTALKALVGNTSGVDTEGVDRAIAAVGQAAARLQPTRSAQNFNQAAEELTSAARIIQVCGYDKAAIVALKSTLNHHRHARRRQHNAQAKRAPIPKVCRRRRKSRRRRCRRLSRTPTLRWAPRPIRRRATPSCRTRVASSTVFKAFWNDVCVVCVCVCVMCAMMNIEMCVLVVSL
jgi:hypothetical protein